MAIAPGTRIGPYETLALIGAGGMGEVWKARDTRLDRVVAIKFSKAALSERFDREARAIAALNHPGICTVHDVGPDYLVMEYVEGRQLQGPLPLAEALRLAILIAEALDAAHRTGIVHRDLKPANILATKSGVKVLDFGLAKFQGAVAADQQTMTMALTDKGEILGTLHYMSPEQVQGKEADARSDIFSFGLVIYEMLAGRRAFHAGNPASLIAAILKEKPEPIENLAPVSPPALSRLISRALEKDPERRWQNIRDVALELESILESPRDVSGPASAARAGFSWRVIAVAALVPIIVSAALFRWMQDSADGTIAKMSIAAVAAGPENEVDPVFSPDGKTLAFARDVHGNFQVFVRSFTAPSAAQITDCSRPCVPVAWSADGARVSYVNGNDLWVTGASGGTPQLLRKSVSQTSSFIKPVAVSPDNRTLVFARERPDGRSEIVMSSPPEADPKPLTNFPPALHPPFSIRFAPDGKKVALSMDDDIIAVPIPSGQLRTVGNLGDAGVYLNWLPDSRHIVYTRGRSSAKEVVLRDSETNAARVILRSGQTIGDVAVSPDGKRMAYHAGDPNQGIIEVSIDSGTVHPLPAPRTGHHNASYSPSGEQYVDSEFTTGRSEIVVRDLAGPHATQLTSESPIKNDNFFESRNFPSFSPDGRRIVFTQGRQIWAIPATGGQPVPITPATDDAIAPAWAPDNRWIAYQRGPSSNRELVKIDSAGQGAAVTLARGLINAGGSQQSGPGVNMFTRWSTAGLIAYLGREGVRVCNSDGSNGRLLVAGAVAGDFNRRGDLFYALKREANQWKLFTVDVASGRVLRNIGTAESPRASVRNANLHPDGKRLMYSRSELGFDIWVLDGLPRPATGWTKLFRHWVEP